MRHYVWAKYLKNDQATARVGPQSHGGGGVLNKMSSDILLRFHTTVSNTNPYFGSNTKVIRKKKQRRIYTIRSIIGIGSLSPLLGAKTVHLVDRSDWFKISNLI